MQYAAQNIIPVTLELGGKSPNIFSEDVCEKDDEFLWPHLCSSENSVP
jgi:aldehyde dehydrogenase